MTKQEREAKLSAMSEELLKLQAKMRESDSHAAKCVKLGLVFAETYPDEAAVYAAARSKFNEVEAAMAAMKAVETDEEPPHIFKEELQ